MIALPARRLALLALFAGTASILSAHAFEAAGYAPCPQCLLQRWPYYLGLPLAAAGAVLGRGRAARVFWLAAAALFAWGAFLGARQAGAEWGFWALETACEAGGSVPRGVEDFRAALSAARVAHCTDPALRILGVSLAGWNAVVSAALCACLASATAKR